MTWKEFKYQVENALQSNGVDPDKQPIELTIPYVWSVDKKLHVEVNTGSMPRRVYMRVYSLPGRGD